MSGFEANSILRVPGRLAINCTDLNLEWPHGGVGLGPVIDIIRTAYGVDFALRDEGFAGIPTEYLKRADVWGLTCFFRSWDDDVQNLVVHGTELGSVSQKRRTSSTVPGGTQLSQFAVPLTFTPEGATHALSAEKPDVEAPFWFFPAAIPMLEEGAQFRNKRQDEIGFPVIFMATPDSNGDPYYDGRRQDIVLP